RGFGWHHPGREAPALRGIDLVVEPGERVLLLGPSGAGKSTFLHALAGVLHDDDGLSRHGELLLDGSDPDRARGRAGLVQQDPESQVVLSRIGDDTAFGLENLAVPREQIWPRVRAALDDVGLTLPLDHPTAALSGGQKQRLALAGAVAMGPGLLLLDEPTANLDPAGVRQVRDAVARCLDRSGATLVVVEHRVAVWADVVDRVVVLGRDGGITHDGSPAQVLGEA
ncbi:ABC transporter ATP-binding protein, partial [Kocuria oceani]